MRLREWLFLLSVCGVGTLLAVVGSFAGIAISDKLGTFVHQGWKYIIVGVAVMTGTFVGSLLWDTLTLKLTGVI